MQVDRNGKWQVTFMGANGEQLAREVVACAYPHNAPKVAIRQIEGESPAEDAKAIVANCRRIEVEGALE